MNVRLATITEESRGEFEAEALPKADGRAPQQLAPIARRIARKYESVGLQKNHAEAFKERAVWTTPAEHGMAILNITISCECWSTHAQHRRAPRIPQLTNVKTRVACTSTWQTPPQQCC